MNRWKMDDLCEYAEALSSHFSVPFRKSKEGKNKNVLLEFIQSVQDQHGSIPFAKKKKTLEDSSLEELMELAKKSPDYSDSKIADPTNKQSWLEFLQPDRKKLSSLTKPELLEKIRQHPEYKKSLERRSKEFLIQILLQETNHGEDNSIKKMEEEEEEEGTISPICLDQFIDSPDPKKIKEAILYCFSEKSLDPKTRERMMEILP